MDVEIKVYQINECDWIAAKDEKSAIEFGSTITDIDEEIKELSHDELVKFTFTDEDGRERSFLDQLKSLVDSGVIFPVFFASTEY